MDEILEFLHPIVWLFAKGVLIVLIFAFVVKPLLNYFIINREIENRKKLAREYQEAKREAEEARAEKTSGHGSVGMAVINKSTQPIQPTAKYPESEQFEE